MAHMTEEVGSGGVLVLNKAPESRDIAVKGEDLEIVGNVAKAVVIATENPILTTFGQEQLVITDKSVDLEAFKADGVPILQGHQKYERALGRATNPVVSDGVLRADLEFDQDYPVAMEQLRAIERGMVKDLSIGLIPTKYKSERVGDTLAESHTITNFYVFEVSCLGAGADNKAGFYRVSQVETTNPEIKGNTQEDNTIESAVTKPEAVNSEAAKETASAVTQEAAPTEASAKATESVARKRAPAIDFINFAKNHYEPAEALNKVTEWENKNFSMAQAKDEVLSTRVRASQVKPEPVARFTDTVNRDNNYTDGKTRASFRGFVDSLVSYGLDKRDISGEASLARDISKQMGGGTGKKMRMPYDMLPTGGRERVFQAGGPTSANTGAPQITDMVRGDKLAEYLYNNTVTGRLGVEVMRDVVDNQSIPRVTNVLEAQFIAEGANAATPDITTDNIKLTPKTAVCATKMSNLSRYQLPGAQSLLERILLRQLNVALDRVTLLGGNTGEPGGIISSLSKGALDTKNQNRLMPGANNANSRKLSVDVIRNLIARIRARNVEGQLAVLAPHEVLEYWRGEQIGTAGKAYKWEMNANSPAIDGNPSQLWGANVYATTNMKQPSGSEDNNDQHRVLVGRFQDMSVVQAFWGNSFMLSLGEPANDFTSDQQTLRMVAYMDVAVPYTQAFEAIYGIQV